MDYIQGQKIRVKNNNGMQMIGTFLGYMGADVGELEIMGDICQAKIEHIMPHNQVNGKKYKKANACESCGKDVNTKRASKYENFYCSQCRKGVNLKSHKMDNKCPVCQTRDKKKGEQFCMEKECMDIVHAARTSSGKKRSVV